MLAIADISNKVDNTKLFCKQTLIAALSFVCFREMLFFIDILR